MSSGHSQPGASLLPARPIRAGLLAFFAALAFIEVGAAAVVAEAWKLQRDGGSLLIDYRWRLDQLLERLRVMEGVVAAGATATTVLWSFLAVHNASRVGRHTKRTAVLVMAAWVAAPAALIVSRATDHGTHTMGGNIVILMFQALVLYVPFGMTAKMTDTVGGPRMPFLRWYLTVAAAFAVHHVFTGALHLGHPQASDNFGRTGMLYLVNAVVVGVIVVMAAEATRSMQVAIDERAWQVRVLQDDAHLRKRAGAPAGEALSLPAPAVAPGTVPTLPERPMPVVSVVPASMAPVPPAPVVLAPPVLAPPVLQAPAAADVDAASGLPSLMSIMSSGPVSSES